jgi:large subunit ribosomal protein L32
MPVPKKKHSPSRQGKRRANWRVSAIALSVCPECHAPTLPHHACPSCGTYQGRTVIVKKGKAEKKAKGKETKETKKEK